MGNTQGQLGGSPSLAGIHRVDGIDMSALTAISHGVYPFLSAYASACFATCRSPDAPSSLGLQDVMLVLC